MRMPFPYFGGKFKIGATIWSMIGNVPNYIEPFCGSAAVLLARPSTPKTETINDIDGLLVNALRAIQWEPEKTAYWADYPVTEIDYNCRHAWLRDQRHTITDKLKTVPLYCDPQAAGWWIWGANLKIGGRWCYDENKEIPHLGDPGKGVNRTTLPHLGDPGTGVKLLPWFYELQRRLSRTRILCGDWQRCLTPSVTTKLGLTGVYLDPPYEGYHESLYSENNDVFGEVVAWCKENQDNPQFRIILSSYSNAEALKELTGWRTWAWHATKGYQKSNQGDHTGKKEILMISPNCLGTTLFEAVNE